MAIIPLGNAGNRTPGQAPRVQIAETGQTGRALERLGAIGLEGKMQRDNDALRAQWEDYERQQKAAEAAARAKDTAALLDTEDRLRDLHDEVSTGVLQGTIPKDKADSVWQERSKKLADEGAASIREESRAQVAPQLQRLTNTLGNGVRKAREKRDRQDITSDLDGIFEKAQRGYARDPQGMTALVESAVANLGGQSLYGPQDLQKKVQGWKENAQFTVAYGAVSAGRNDPKALANAEKMLGTLTDLDPQKKAVLEDRIAGYRLHMDQQRELAAQRQARAAEASLKRAEAAFNAANALAEVGALNPEYSDKQLAVMAGTPYAAAFKEVLKRQAENGTLSAQAPATLRAQLDQVNARLATSATPELKAQRDRLSRIVDGQESAIKSEGLLRAANKYGVVTEPPKPLDMSGGLAGLPKQLQARAAAVEASAQWAKADPEWLYPQESMRVKEMIDMLPAKEQAVALDVLGKALGRRGAIGFAKQYEKLTQGGSLQERALGYAMSMNASSTTGTTDNRLRSELVLKGAAAIKSGASTKGEKAPGEKASTWKTQISQIIEGFPNEAVRNQITEAALLMAHGIAGEQGGALDKDDIARATRLAIGTDNLVRRGVEVRQEGRKNISFIPLPAGKKESDLDRAIEQLTPQKIGADEVIAGGQRMLASEFVKRVLPNAQLSFEKTGVYVPMVGERPVMKPDGSWVKFEVR